MSKGTLCWTIHIATVADYERIDAEADNDEEYRKLIESIVDTRNLPVDQFYRVIQSS